MQVSIEKPGTPQELVHHGIKGMHWGVRKEVVHPSIAHIPKATRKEAKKDAEEFTRAKLFYGQGAGIRRRLIKAKVESRREKDKLYGKAFDHFVKQTDLAQRASQARNQRKRKDATKRIKKITKKTSNILVPILYNDFASHSSDIGEMFVKEVLVKVDIEKPGTPGEVLEYLEHHGVLGMKWGRRAGRSAGSAGKTAGKKTWGGVKAVGRKLDNANFALGAHSGTTNQAIVGRASKLTKKELPGIKAKHGAYGKLRNRAKHPFSPEAKAYRNDVKKAYVKNLEHAANSITNVQKNRQYTLTDHGKPNTSKYRWKVSVQPIAHSGMAHASDNETFEVRPIFDDEGYIVDIEMVDPSMAQGEQFVTDFLAHMNK